ncbi:hypothetical protein BH11PLA1_BH11PLA1_18850 [soil metagenome]
MPRSSIQHETVGARRGGIRRARGGLTLIEAVIAVVILSIGVPPLLLALRNATVRRVSQTLSERARWLAVERLETVLADRNSSARGYGYITGSNYPAEAAVSGYAAYSRSVTLTTTGANFAAGTGYCTASVTVGYTDPVRGATALSLSTVVTDYTP